MGSVAVKPLSKKPSIINKLSIMVLLLKLFVSTAVGLHDRDTNAFLKSLIFIYQKNGSKIMIGLHD